MRIETASNNWLLVLAVFAWSILVVAVCIYGFNFFHQPVSSNPADWGSFGDFFGGTLNPIFSLMSFIALLATIHIQIKEYSRARIEMIQSFKAQNEMVKEAQMQQQINKQAALVPVLTQKLERHLGQLDSLLNTRVLDGFYSIKDLFHKSMAHAESYRTPVHPVAPNHQVIPLENLQEIFINQINEMEDFPDENGDSWSKTNEDPMNNGIYRSRLNEILREFKLAVITTRGFEDLSLLSLQTGRLLTSYRAELQSIGAVLLACNSLNEAEFPEFYKDARESLIVRGVYFAS